MAVQSLASRLEPTLGLTPRIVRALLDDAWRIAYQCGHFDQIVHVKREGATDSLSLRHLRVNSDITVRVVSVTGSFGV